MGIKESTLVQSVVACAVAISMSAMMQARAQALQHVTYVGGTVLPGGGIAGKLSVASSDSLVFEGKATVTVPYDHVISYESTTHKQVHVGLLTEGFWRLLAPWPEEKRLSLSFRDADDHPQVVVLGMSKGDEAMLVEVLKTRTSRGPSRPQLTFGNPVASGR